MTVFPILAEGFIMTVVGVLFVLCCVALILIVLIQKGRGGGLSAAFGGAMAGGILGSKTGDFLTWVTIVLVSVFLILAIVMAKFYRPAPVSDYDTSIPVQQQPLPSTEQPMPSADIGDQTSDANSGVDANSPGE